ncbi:MAG: hypothetical protein Kow00105_04760 [Phycisphaeraceae bacterium]
MPAQGQEASLSQTSDAEVAGDLDPSLLIDTLAREGMSELLLHLAETEPMDDPVMQRQVTIAGLRIEYHRLVDESAQAATDNPELAVALRRQAVETYGRLTDAWRGLIRDFPDHEQRPIWQTDLAQSLIVDLLYGLHQSAPLFLEFGITTPEQETAVSRYAPEALALLSDAQLRLFHLRGEVGRDEERSVRMQASGLFFRLFEEYDRRRIPYFLAMSAHLVALLPDDSPYFQGEPPAEGYLIPRREEEPSRERSRLLDLATHELDKLKDQPGIDEPLRLASQALRGSVLLARGRADQAIEAVQDILRGEHRGVHWLTANLVTASALAEKGLSDQALVRLRELAAESTVLEHLRHNLLVTDLIHRIMLAEAYRQPPSRRDEAIARSYEPYLALLSGPYPGRQMQGLRDFIYRRWASALGDDVQAESLPPLVRLAVSQVFRREGQAMMDRLDAPESEVTESERLALRSKAQEKLNEAIRLAQSVTGPDIEPDIRAEAMFNLALAMHTLDPNDADNRLSVTKILTDLAEQMPDQPVAEDAITAAVSLLRELHQVVPTPPRIEQAYVRAAEVLFSKFPTSEAADNERIYFGYHVLEQAGKHREAVRMYQQVPFDHDQYFEAQRQALLSLRMLERESGPAEKLRIRRELESLIKRIVREAGEVRDSRVNPDRATSARRAEATTKLVAADLALDIEAYDKVREVLAGFEDDYADQPDLIAEALRMRIIALADSGQHEALAESAKRMIEAYPEQGAPVIDRVLSQVEQRIESLQLELTTADSLARPKIEQQLRDHTRAADVLSQYLLAWAKGQGFDAEAMLPFEVVRGKALRLAGKLDEAEPILRRLIHDFPNDAQVMLEYAQLLYDRGDEASLIESVRYFDRLITGLESPYPKAWWLAWMRRLQINDRLGERTEDIPLRVRQLRMTDPDLGGPMTRYELERLERKHAG